MDCSKNFHSSLDFVNSASKHYVVQHCTAGVCKQSKHYIYIYNYSPSRSKTPSSLRPLHLYFYLGQNLVPILSANCLAFGKDFKTSNTWSGPSTTSWTRLRTSSRSRPWSCPSTSSLSGPTRGLQRLYGPGPSSTSSSGPTDGISARGCWSRSLYSGFRCDPVFFPQLWSVDTILVKLC